MSAERMFAPASEAELAELIAAHHANGDALRIQGGGTRVAQDGVAGARLTTSAISGVVEYEPGAMTLIARTGTPLAEVEALVAAEGQSLAFEPADMRAALRTLGQSTLGGVVATNASGPRRLTVGACRDHLLGLRFVDGQGRIVKNGGRVMKNVTGLDLSKLLAGSYGTLGILTEVALKTLPMAASRMTLVLPGINVADAVSTFSKVLSTPFEITGAAFTDQTAWLRIEGLQAQVHYRRDRLIDLLRPMQVDTLDDAQTVDLWRDLRDLRHLPNDAPLWRILTKPTETPALEAALAAQGGTVALDWGGGLVWYAGPATAETLRRLAKAGHATLVRRGGIAGATFPPQAEPLRQLSERVRASLDPARILNRGLMES